jgi:hypothetical protein
VKTLELLSPQTPEPFSSGELAARKRPTRTRRLVGIALFVFLSVAAVIVITPRLVKRFLPQLTKARSARVASSPVDPGPPPTVQVVWEQLDLGAMPADVAQDLKSGKYYYDNRFPGNFGLAIDYWKQAQASSSDTSAVQSLVASAERERVGQFSSDSGDVIVLLKQGKRDQAVALLDKMRADFLDIAASQYRWASAMLSRQRR